MVWTGLSFLAGILLFQHLSALPPWWLALLLMGAGLSVVRWWRWPMVFVAGFLWTWWTAADLLSTRLPEDLTRRDLVITGFVDSLPQLSGDSQRFVFNATETRLTEAAGPVNGWKGRVRLRWRAPLSPVGAGESWTLKVRLFFPSGYRNPGGGDYERWLYTNRISATGYVLSSSDNRKQGNRTLRGWHHRVRERVSRSIDELAEPSEGRALLKALVIGDRSGFEDRHWEVFRQTGTSHLVAISGLHLGLLAGLVFWVANRLWRLSERLCRAMPAILAAAIAALVAAAAYALLAGFSLPTQRALLMMFAASLALLLRRNMMPMHTLVLALVAVLLVDPNAVLSAGFWLSFAAVSFIFLVLSGSVSRNRLLSGGIRVQFAVTIGLVPVLAAWGLPLSPVAPLVNLIAVPWFSLVVVPLSMIATLIAVVLPVVGGGFIQGALFVLDLTWQTLSWASDTVSWTWIVVPPDLGRLALAAVGTVVLLVPLQWRLRAWGCVMMLPLVLPYNDMVAPGALRLAVLDVGQGLAVVAQTANHVLVYDLGPRYPSGFNTAEAVVVPYLASQGLRQVDMLVLSHDDVDHSGAWRRFTSLVPVLEVVSGQPEEIGEPAGHCSAGKRWLWDGLVFEVLHPEVDQVIANDNDRSCVIRIIHPGSSVLFTGDITRQVESRLVALDAEKLVADIVVVPHHGSGTSSSKAFVDATGARLALVSAGHDNRYGFPHKEVARRWSQVGAQVLGTADSGALLVDVPVSGPPVVSRYREVTRRYWHR